MKFIKLADWSEYPGTRGKKESEYSAEEYFEDVLLPEFNKAVEGNYVLSVDLSGTAGIAGSWIDEAFGRLTLHYPVETINRLLFVPGESQDYKNEVWGSIAEWHTYGIHDNSPLKRYR